MHSTPKELDAYDKGYRLRRQIKDEEMWIMGRYVLSAVSVALEHAFSKKAKSEYLKEPFMTKIHEDDSLTQEELDNREIQKMILYEEQWAKQARRNGLAETIIK